jgi:DNA-binding transcriptional ArsR family regulator
MESTRAIAALRTLAQETRLAIYRLLVDQGSAGLPAGSIGDALKLAPATLSFHLRDLSHAGLVRSRQQGRFIYYRADFERMNDLLGYLTENCCAREPRLAVDHASLFSTSHSSAPPPAPKPLIHPKQRPA